MSKSPNPPAGSVATVASGMPAMPKKPKRIGNQPSGAASGILQATAEKLG